MPQFALSPIVERYILHVKVLRACAPGLSVACLALSIVSAAAATASIVCTGRLVASLNRDQPTAFGWAIATALTFLIIPLAGSALSAVGQVIADRYLVLITETVFDAGLSPDSLTVLEDPETVGRLKTAGEASRDWLFQSGVQATWSLLTIRLSAIGAFAVLTTWSWWPPVLLAVGWTAYSRAFGRWSSTIFDGLLDLTGTDRRRAGYLRDLLIHPNGAKEVRLFGLTDLLVSRYVTVWHRAQSLVWAHRRSSVRRTLIVLLAPLVATAVVVLLLIVDVDRSRVDAGALVTLVQAISAMAAFGPHTDPQVALTRTLSTLSVLGRTRTDLGLPELLPPVQGSPAEPRFFLPAEDPTPIPAAIRLTDVCFSYPTAPRPTLNGVNLEIPAGQSVAVVGLNGAGKSTLIKLLCGLYQPDTGAVRIDESDPGVDRTVRSRLAVIFQDFVRYQLSLRDNIAPEVSPSGADALVARAMHDAEGDEILQRLQHGFDTVLSAEYTGGTDLSGGQWQRVALARALAALSTGAGVLILDEPTAALDVRAEAALFDRFLTVARGATTVLVSHRLSSVRHVDRIVVLADTGDGSRIVEDGSHHELIGAGGRYAELFRLQASRFGQQRDAS
ncbi:ABC transporter ATP-binding protein [Microlunatus soli]|uniref:ATP-binding cassette, subfamily C n=1 Tax=Microlunatus soli TaxID=630515 RepID=A0A1H1Z7F4_9ACTN|nr:ABC transporter ATP-binding protein [Microlunatus soli]SDT29442.1 ATP-binding cassette, subfamily C [Microlunatus soli]